MQRRRDGSWCTEQSFRLVFQEDSPAGREARRRPTGSITDSTRRCDDTCVVALVPFVKGYMMERYVFENNLVVSPVDVALFVTGERENGALNDSCDRPNLMNRLLKEDKDSCRIKSRVTLGLWGDGLLHGLWQNQDVVNDDDFKPFNCVDVPRIDLNGMDWRLRRRKFDRSGRASWHDLEC